MAASMLALGFALKTLQDYAVTKGDSVTLCNEQWRNTPKNTLVCPQITRI